MNQDRWDQVKNIFHAAMEREGEDRQAYLESACTEDAALRQEVESLLAQYHESADSSPFREPALQAAARALARRHDPPPSRDLTGQTLAHFRILEKIGQGGMGVVYRALDTHLHRDVAIKVLPDSLVTDTDRKSRFVREARLLAGLNVSNVAAIHGFQEVEGTPFLVLEMVEGPTIADRLKDGPLPLEEVLDIGLQIAAGLEAAHEKGIVHRDLKPANLKITPKGQVKILDFGLAKAFGEPVQKNGLPSLPAGTEPLTSSGMILGTPAYMSPEQARGKEADRRTDIWGFGCVLFEALTGSAAFSGPTSSDILAAVLHREPDWAALPADTPAPLRRMLRRCLQKDPARRLGAICDARLELSDSAEIPAPDSGSGAERPTRKRSIGRRAASWLIIALLGAALWMAYRIGHQTAASPIPVRSSLALSSDNSLRLESGVAISPDGSTIAFAARSAKGRHLYLRRLDQWDPQLVPDTSMAVNPSFSPDSRWVSFYQKNTLVKIPVSGGPLQTITKEMGGFGNKGQWESQDHLFFGRWPRVGLWRISAQGGDMQLIAKPAEGGTIRYLWPEALPDKKGILFTLLQPGKSSVALLPAGSDQPRILVESGCYPRYVSTGHLLYVNGRSLYAAAFDLSRLSLQGLAVPVMEDLLDEPLGAAEYDVSDNGTLVFSRASTYADNLVWKDRQGKTLSVIAQAYKFESPTLSPDAEKYSTVIRDGYIRNIYVGNASGGPLTRLTFGNDDWSGIWSADGRHLFYLSGQSGTYNIFRVATDGSGKPERLTQSPNPQGPSSVSPDNRRLLFVENNPETHTDIWELNLDNGSKRPVVQTPFDETAAHFSPDGHWIAYMSNESGNMEVYVQAYPDGGRKQRISLNGFGSPFWSHDGREVFYRNMALFSVPILDIRDFKVGPRQTLFELPNRAVYGSDCISPDGRRFLMIEQVGKFEQLSVVQNWFEELKRLVPIPGR